MKYIWIIFHLNRSKQQVLMCFKALSSSDWSFHWMLCMNFIQQTKAKLNLQWTKTAGLFFGSNSSLQELYLFLRTPSSTITDILIFFQWADFLGITILLAYNLYIIRTSLSIQFSRFSTGQISSWWLKGVFGGDFHNLIDSIGYLYYIFKYHIVPSMFFIWFYKLTIFSIIISSFFNLTPRSTAL